MNKITFEDLFYIMSYDITKNKSCIEIAFSVDDCDQYQNSWLGKTVDGDTNKVVYWFGLTIDGLQAYDFDSFERFVNATVFCGKSIKDIWESVSIRSIDACNVQERLSFYSRTIGL